MSVFQANITRVLVKYEEMKDQRDEVKRFVPFKNKRRRLSSENIYGEGISGTMVTLPEDTTSCFILYPKSPADLVCEISTYKDSNMSSIQGESSSEPILQTISERGFINACKLIPGYRKTLRNFISVPYTSGEHSNTSSEDEKVKAKIYCQNSCISDRKLWSPAIDYIKGETSWNGGPCQLVSRKNADYMPIQLDYYDRIYERSPGVYIFHLHSSERGPGECILYSDRYLVWNTSSIDVDIPGRERVAPASYQVAYFRTEEDNLLLEKIPYSKLSFYYIRDFGSSEIKCVSNVSKGRLLDEKEFKRKNTMLVELTNHSVKLSEEDVKGINVGNQIHISTD